jgi:hypothetical protein
MLVRPLAARIHRSKERKQQDKGNEDPGHFKGIGGANPQDKGPLRN